MSEWNTYPPLACIQLINAIGEKMAMKPRIKVKARGIPIGDYDAAPDSSGKVKIKPKRKRRPLPQQIAASKARRWKGAT